MMKQIAGLFLKPAIIKAAIYVYYDCEKWLVTSSEEITAAKTAINCIMVKLDLYEEFEKALNDETN